MKITIDAPDIMPADFTNPSTELLDFIKQFQNLCIHLTKQYRQVDGRKLFSAYVRNGDDTVFDTEDYSTSLMFHPDESADIDGEDYFEDEDYDTESSPIRQVVYMKQDLPEKWVVARLCIDGWNEEELNGYETLYSTDFRPRAKKPAPAKALMDRVVRHLAARAHTVPRSSQ